MATYDETAVGPATPMTGTTTTSHMNQVVAMFDTYAQARAARDKLASSGIAASDMDILDRNAEATDTAMTYNRDSEGFWGALKGMFMPEDDSHGYAEGLERGHAMLVVRPQAAMREQVVTVLEGFDPIDFDAKQTEWKQSGWTGHAAGASTAAAPMVIPPVMGTTSATTTSATTGMAAATARGTIGAVAGADDKIQVVEERLRVGKREVAAGGIRVRSYVVERPVEESVTLHEERVSIERHPVDRAVGVGVDAFTDRTIAVTATSEEAVVGKDVRVVEEIGLHKDVSDRTETVRDTVRHTEVEVEDATKTMGATVKGATTVTGTTTTGSMPKV